MASGWTNNGYELFLKMAFQATGDPTGGWWFMLCTESDSSPFQDRDKASQFTDTAGGVGDAGGGDYDPVNLAQSGAGSTIATADNTNDWATVVFDDIVFTMDQSVTNVYYCLLCDRDPYGVLTSTEVLGWFDLSGPLSITSGNTLTVTNATLRLRKTTP